MPLLSDQMLISIGASDCYVQNAIDPQFFVSYSITPANAARATPQIEPPTASFLIDSGATHDVLSKSFSHKAGLELYTTRSLRTVSGFDGSRSQSARKISL